MKALALIRPLRIGGDNGDQTPVDLRHQRGGRGLGRGHGVRPQLRAVRQRVPPHPPGCHVHSVMLLHPLRRRAERFLRAKVHQSPRHPAGSAARLQVGCYAKGPQQFSPAAQPPPGFRHADRAQRREPVQAFRFPVLARLRIQRRHCGLATGVGFLSPLAQGRSAPLAPGFHQAIFRGMRLTIVCEGLLQRIHQGLHGGEQFRARGQALFQGWRRGCEGDGGIQSGEVRIQFMFYEPPQIYNPSPSRQAKMAQSAKPFCPPLPIAPSLPALVLGAWGLGFEALPSQGETERSGQSQRCPPPPCPPP